MADAVDWRKSGAVTKVKDQGSCGERSCLYLYYACIAICKTHLFLISDSVFRLLDRYSRANVDNSMVSRPKMKYTLKQ